MKPFTLQEHILNSKKLYHQVHTLETPVSELKDQFIDNNVMDVELDTPIYRIFSQKWFNDLLANKHLMLLHTTYWQDPFENFLLNARWETADGIPVSVDRIRDQYYGQCWTLREECDGLWRNYRGPSDDPQEPDAAIKVATTVRKLMEQFYDVTAQHHEFKFFLGKVEYCSDEEINQFFTQPEAMNSAANQSNIRFPQTMLIKRKAFSYEEEVRLIYCDNVSASQRAAPSTGKHPVKIDLNYLFDYIELDPMMKEPAVSANMAKIAAAGYTGAVRQSTLYNNPNFVVRLA